MKDNYHLSPRASFRDLDEPVEVRIVPLAYLRRAIRDWRGLGVIGALFAIVIWS